jgi:hypothetical protein
VPEKKNAAVVSFDRVGEVKRVQGRHCGLEGYARTGNWSWDLGGDRLG